MDKTRENNGITVEKLSELGTPFLCIFLMNISNRFARSLFRIVETTRRERTGYCARG